VDIFERQLNFYILGFIKVGGMSTLFQKYFDAIPSAESGVLSMSVNMSTLNNTYMYNLTGAMFSNVTQQCGLPRSDAFHIFRDPVNSDLPWPGVMIRTTLISTWFWCCDQVLLKM
jgi:hypothetical protein